MNIDLRHLWTGEESVRRIAVFASQLPAGSRCAQALLEDDMWTTTNFQIAALIDSTRAVGWNVANKGVETRHHTDKPQLSPRPSSLRESKANQDKTLRNAERFRRRRRPRDGS